MTEPDRESEIIKRLREQVHKSFLQISEMEKLFHMEMEHAKEEFDERERAIKQKEDDIRQKYSQLEANMRNKDYFLVDVGDFDISLDEIAYKKEDTLTDSGIDKIREYLLEEERRATNDPEAQIGKLKELQQNRKLREELLNCQQTAEVYKNKILDADRTLEKQRFTERKLQKQNEHLNDMYFQEASQNANVEEEIKRIRGQLTQKSITIDELKEHITKLSDSLQSINKIDITRINFKLPAPNTSKPEAPVREKPAFLRMTTNSVLMRNKSNTPMTPITQLSPDTALSPKPQFPNVEYGPKYFKRKAQIKRTD